jgi:DNA ligase 1
MDAPGDVDPQGYLVSEKLDGVRAVWNGKDLRFRSGLPIVAPDSFLRRLPAQALDGELWMGRGRFEALVGVVRRQRPSDDEWHSVRYAVFDMPHEPGPFQTRSIALARLVEQHGWPALEAVVQKKVASRSDLFRWLDRVVAAGGEGLMLRAADAPYRAGRSQQMLKLKPIQDDEAVVLAHEPGKGRLAGHMGALRVRTARGIEFKIGSGFSDAQRLNPPAIGQRVTFSYRGLTDEGVPRFASFVRVRPEGI